MKTLNPLSAAGIALALFACGMFFGDLSSTRAKAQSTITAPADITLTIGRQETYTLSANEFAAVPTCSLAAGCKGQLQLCNFQPPPHASLADSTHCIVVNANSNGATSLWVGVLDTIQTPATGTPTSISTAPFQIGTASTWVTAAEVKQTP